MSTVTSIITRESFRLDDGRRLEIRKMRAEDVREVGRLEQEIFSSPWSEESFLAGLGHPNACLSLVGTVSGEVATYAVCWIVVPELHIGNIAVARGFRRLGIGKQLMKFITDYSNEQGCTMAHLEVRRSNSAAIALYDKLGFSVVGVRSGYYQDNGEDALLMNKQW